MDLASLQETLQQIYDVDPGHDVRRFVITDARLARILGGGRESPERLLVRCEAGEVALSLYIDEAVLARLRRDDPLRELHPGNLADFCTALEGVSHFVYLAFHAGHDRPVTRLELELQAEVDKYVTAAALMVRQRRRLPPRALRRRLFHHVRFAAGMPAEELRRYWWANRYADLYCAGIERVLRQGPRLPPLANELRRFYRLPQAGKIARARRFAAGP
ncbi:hypothetical protein [Inmirania thermothiophila]|uniref:Uncharacterized protein n=1 Tax=Inmirania thermothiophila TaxID=1750597 RepID=A0A3N1Y053_9GAMM|nr:hypothetical protein [Inmirania thermothiophila]ROR32206.1 hypothetical protein EDC57_1403 [Inmirania thermothiophila]